MSYHCNLVSSPESRRKALIIAVSEYDDSSNLKNLPFCKNDGNEMIELLKDVGYEIKNIDGLIGHIDGKLMQDCIYSFFKDDIKSDDTLLFYFSGHGVPDNDDFFLSSSNIDQSKPKMRGFSFADLNGEITYCHAKRIVVILDSCHAGSLNLSSKGNESALATLAKNQLSTTFKEGEGKCLLASSMGFQESFANAEGDHSFFTNYLLNGLRGADGKSVDNDGNVTPDSLMQYIDSEIDKLPVDKRPSQTPLRKIETVGKIMLAHYPQLIVTSTHNTRVVNPSISKLHTIGRISFTGDDGQKQVATAFLIGPNLIMAKYFWFTEKFNDCTVEFNFGYAEDGNPIEREVYNLNSNEEYLQSDSGFSIFAINGIPGNKFGWLTFPKIQHGDSVGDYVYLVHNFGPEKKATSLHENVIKAEGEWPFKFSESLNDGVSTVGSPVFDAKWNLIGIQKAYRDKYDGVYPTKERTILTTEGILARLKQICNDYSDPMACKVLESLELRD